MNKVYIEKRPWGNFKQFTFNEKSTVKILTVKPNSILSLQFHRKRDELWYFITDGYVQIGRKKKKVKKDSIINIKRGTLHRLFSKNKEVKVLEISFGRFDENDITRIEDIYGRIKNRA
ncbi:MAG: mannose-6-phosphate isomerase [Candidatus Pacearchaeota archaeon]